MKLSVHNIRGKETKRKVDLSNDIFGIEPNEARGMSDSLKSDNPLNKVHINSIADSLCAPLHMPYSFSIAKQVINSMINISDKDMANAMIYAFKHLKLFLVHNIFATIPCRCTPRNQIYAMN